MFKLLLVSLLSVLLVIAPWRLLNLAAHTLVGRPGTIHTTQKVDRYWDVVELQTRLELLGWDVSYHRDLRVYGQPAYGVTDPSSHRIVIDEALYWNDRLAVLAHEAGHTVQPALTAQGFECWAESVAYLVAQDGVTEHARYLSPYKYTCVALMVTHWPELYAAKTLIDALD